MKRMFLYGLAAVLALSLASALAENGPNAPNRDAAMAAPPARIDAHKLIDEVGLTADVITSPQEPGAAYVQHGSWRFTLASAAEVKFFQGEYYHLIVAAGIENRLRSTQNFCLGPALPFRLHEDPGIVSAIIA